MAKLSRAERIERAKSRLSTSAKRTAKFRAAYGAQGIALDDQTLARMATIEPLDLSVRVARDPEETLE